MNVKLRVLSAGVLFFMGQSVVAQVKKSDTIKTTDIQEVVVLGYRNVTKKTSVTSSTTLSSDKIEQRPNANVLNAVQGQISGVNVASGTGQPGAKPTIIIRGVGTLIGSTDPLYVIDGFPTNSDAFKTLNSNDIESFTVLKDASAIAEYGNRGSNGVVIIKTKRGSFGGDRMVFNYRSQTGVSTLQDPKYRYANSRELLTLEKRRSVGLGSTLSDAQIAAFDIDTDWKKEFFRPSFVTTHDLSIQTNSKNFSTYTNVGYLNQEGILRGTDLSRYNLRNNITGRTDNGKFSYYIGTGIGFARSNEADLRAGAINYNPVTGAFVSAPYLSPSQYTGSRDLVTLGGGSLLYTPLYIIDRLKTGTNITDDQKFNVNTELKYEILPGFKALTRTSAEYLTTRTNSTEHPISFNRLYFQVGTEAVGIESIVNRREFYFNQLAQLSYEKEIGLHTFSLNGNFEYDFANVQNDNFTQRGLNPRTFVPGAGTGYVNNNGVNFFNIPTVGASQLRLNLLSFFGAFEYDYDKRYGLVVNGRRDGTSRFGVGNQWGNFYSVGARWNVSEETFMSNVSFINDLKFRGSFGTTGNQRVIAGSVFTGLRPPLFLSTYSFANTVYAGQQGFGISYADESIRWETTKNYNLGMDFSLFDRRLSGSFDLYKKVSENILSTEPQAPVLGTLGIVTNTAIDIENKGIDVELKYDIYRNRERNINFSIFGNGNYNQQKLSDIPNGEELGSLTTTRDGYKTDLPLLFHYLGVNPSNGNMLYEAADGSATENPVTADKKLGKYNYLPEYQGGFGFNFNVKGLYMNTLFTYVANIDRFDFDKSGLYDPATLGSLTASSDLLNAWTPANTNTNIPSLTANSAYDSQSDRFLVDASYLRIRNIQFGYKIPKEILGNSFINSMSIFVQGENLYTWSKWDGFDAESNRGSDQDKYPTPRTFTLGFDIKF